MANTVPVKYVGRHLAVELDPDGLGEITVVRGETINVPPDVAASLLEQYENWQTIRASSPPAELVKKGDS